VVPSQQLKNQRLPTKTEQKFSKQNRIFLIRTDIFKTEQDFSKQNTLTFLIRTKFFKSEHPDRMICPRIIIIEAKSFRDNVDGSHAKAQNIAKNL